jgi:YhcH/YjgK/YiaL family protein
MVTDFLTNLGKYKSLLSVPDKVLGWLSGVELQNLSTGKHLIDGDSIYALIQEYQTCPAGDKYWESHKKYTDLQIVISGEEFMGYIPSTGLNVLSPYDEAKDISFYENETPPCSLVHVTAGHFCLFFPGEVHKPGLTQTAAGTVKKAVLKIAAEKGTDQVL